MRKKRCDTCLDKVSKHEIAKHRGFNLCLECNALFEEKKVSHNGEMVTPKQKIARMEEAEEHIRDLVPWQWLANLIVGRRPR